ncbi:Zona pellucida-like domain containing protein 6 [Sarcoptes scabiei]|uniref:Zona pellucida-like domain containing protein 6 n=1 Tax=Sarcoptes scabiei TaxID=52283 RepID=A0A131ZWE0_SARSC|nr:Zona pellucida-like domain containing protein 6 [Sarcoptes scabiei]
MKVNLEFDRPFNGLIFSKGFYRLQANFEIYLGTCGMTSSEKSNNPASSLGLFIENTIIIQYDPQVQEIWDQARKLRCTWYDFYEKSVTFRPFNVDMLDAVTANFLGDNIQCWMQIQVGKGPWASEVAGIVKIGQTMTMVLAIKDEENKFDMLVRNCIAHDGKHQPIQLVDEYGCIVRPKIMSKFQKVKNFGHSATVVSYAYFQAFKFPDSMNVHFQCVIQVCRFDCPPVNCEGDSLLNDQYPIHKDSNDNRKFLNRIGEIATTVSSISSPSIVSNESHLRSRSIPSQHSNETKLNSFTLNSLGARPRSMNLNKLKRKRSINHPTTKNQQHLPSPSSATVSMELSKDINTEKIIKVVAPGDVAFALPLMNPDSRSSSLSSSTSMLNSPDSINISLNSGNNLICMPATGFIISLVVMILLLLLTCLVTIFLLIRLKNVTKNQANKLSSPSSSSSSSSIIRPVDKFCIENFRNNCNESIPNYVSIPSILYSNNVS